MPPMTEQERLFSSNAAIQGAVLLDKSNVPSIAPRGNPECRVKRRGIAGEDGPGPLRGLILNRSELLKKSGGRGKNFLGFLRFLRTRRDAGAEGSGSGGSFPLALR